MFRRRNVDIWCERYGARGERTSKKKRKKKRRSEAQSERFRRRRAVGRVRGTAKARLETPILFFVGLGALHLSFHAFPTTCCLTSLANTKALR